MSINQILGFVMIEIIILFLIFQSIKIIKYSYVIFNGNELIIKQTNIKIATNNQRSAGFHFKFNAQKTNIVITNISDITLSSNKIIQNSIQYTTPFIIKLNDQSEYIWNVSQYRNKQISKIQDKLNASK